MEKWYLGSCHCGAVRFEACLDDSGAPYYNINVACLEGVDVNELISAPITYYDGLHDNWGSTPAETRHL